MIWHSCKRWIVLVSALALLTGCTGLLFQPMKQHLFTPDIVNTEYKDITIVSDKGIHLHGWRLLAQEDDNEKSHTAKKGNILFLHGNGENISTHFGNLYWLMQRGYDGYIFDYRGYGKSEGIPELDGVVRDVRAMLDYMISVTPPDQQLIVIGHSMGGALAIYAVATHPRKQRITALVTIEAFSDYRQVTRDVLGNSWLTWALQWPLSLTIDNSYRPLDYVADVSPAPLLIMHSKQDRLVPYYHALALYEQARQPKQFIDINSDHNHIFNIKANRRLLLEYLQQLSMQKRPGLSRGDDTARVLLEEYG